MRNASQRHNCLRINPLWNRVNSGKLKGVIEIVCAVRNCHEPLAIGLRAWTCPRGHSFDVARSGYCNLLQPNERRSRHPGDSPDVARARRRLLDRGVGTALVDVIVRLCNELSATGPLLDAGCGEGTHLADLCSKLGTDGVGIDISSAAVELAARRHREQTWIVSNVDRRIPLADRSIGTILSITSRVNRDEFARIIRPGGLLFVVFPGPDDLAELREAVMGERPELERVPDIDHPNDPIFDPVRQEAYRETKNADTETLEDLLRSTYRGRRHSQSGAVSSIDRLTVTHSRTIEVYSARETSP